MSLECVSTSWTMEAPMLQTDLCVLIDTMVIRFIPQTPSFTCNVKSIHLLLSQYLWSAQINNFFFITSEHVLEQKKNKEPTRGTDYICLYLFSSEHNFIHCSSSFHTFQKDHNFWDCLINYFIKVVKKLDVTWTKASIILQYTGSVIAIIIIITVMIRLYDWTIFISIIINFSLSDTHTRAHTHTPFTIKLQHQDKSVGESSAHPH